MGLLCVLCVHDTAATIMCMNKENTTD